MGLAGRLYNRLRPVCLFWRRHLAEAGPPSAPAPGQGQCTIGLGGTIAANGTDMGDPRNTSWLSRFGAKRRLGTALVVAIAAFLIQPDSISRHTRAVASWDLGTLAYLCLAWMLIARSDARVTREHALGQDQSGYVIFLFVVGAACASTVAIGFVAGTIRDLPFWARAWHLTLTITALVSSWLLIQTVFAFHYAHRYYAGPHGEPAATASLEFPGGREPDYMDFAYYAFVVGMTSQGRRSGVAQHAEADDDPRRPRVPVQHRRARPQYQPAKIYLVSSSSIRYRVPSPLLEPFATSAIRALCAQCQIRAALISSTAPSSPAR